MSRTGSIVVHIIMLVENFCGLAVNGFITVTTLMDSCGSRKLKPFDKIFFILGITRLFFTCFLIFNIMNQAFSLNIYHINVPSWMLNTVYLFLGFFSLWFSKWLCVLYYVKVTSSKSTLLIRIKLSITELVPFEGTLDIIIPPRNMEINASLDTQLLSICSNITSFTTPSVDAHLSAIRSVIIIEVMTFIKFIVTILLCFDFYDVCNKRVLLIFAVYYPILHSVALIAGNAKLKKAALRILHYFKKCGTEILVPNLKWLFL
ncbi:LOW QUALITY PROTEIN: taste receptor type 2 member 39-like [Rhinoderma darwinii]|uniref:LOW QUALITY PROTEIN: taste receptor type 2 member 39-like n=1 Tax=Rhinoderma darwinii TaxID=43563 RepID=UPI003F67D465